MDDTKRPLRLLSLDGGGIRGLSSLYILKSIMSAAQSNGEHMTQRPLLPCEHFDLVAGTSTGGLIAVMLGTLRMDIDTCIKEYVDMAPQISLVEGLVSRSSLGKLWTVARGKQRFSPAPLEAAIKRLVVKHLGDRATKGEDTPLRFEACKYNGTQECKVFVCVTSEKLGKHFRFRSYESSWDITDDCPIWQTCRATSAAPTFFPPIVIGNPPVAYVDGGLGYNNPIRALMEEVTHIWQPGRKIGCIVSIGTGIAAPKDIGRTIKPLFETLKAMSTDTETVAQEFKKEMEYKHGVEQKLYFRFNVQHGLEHVGLEEWKNMDRTKVATQDFLNDQWSQVDACASQLYKPTASISLRPAVVPEISFFNVTAQRVTSFVVRSALHNLIRSKLHDTLGDKTQHQRIIALHGLGGAGKTQLAINYIQEYRNEYSGIFWIDASRKDSVEQLYVQLYRLLFKAPTMSDQDLPKFEDLVLLVKDWFSHQTERYLLVFDSADNIDDPEDPFFVDIAIFIPRYATVDVLITTRCSTAKDLPGSESMEVKEMEEQEALELLLMSSGLIQENEELSQHLEAKSIVKELGYLALAINLAGSYISNTPRLLSDLAQYLPEYRERRQVLLNQKPIRLVHQYGESVLGTWETSFQAVNRKSSVASNLLSFLAFLDSDRISPGLFNMAMDETSITEQRDVSWGQIISHDKSLCIYDIEEALSILASFSLIRIDKGGYSMHKLVHAWGYERLNQRQRFHLVRATLSFLSKAISNVSNLPADRMLLVAHLMASFKIVSAIVIENRDGELFHVVCEALSRFASFMSNMGLWSNEAAIERFTYNLLRNALGEDHPKTISVMDDVANTLRELGKLDEAASMKEDALEKSTRIHGEEHNETVAIMGGLANMLVDLGKLEEAASMMKFVLEKSTRIFGEEHPATLTAMNNLATTLRYLGKVDEAASMMKTVLEKSTRTLGKEHPDTISALSGFAIALRDLRKLEEAVPLMKEALGESTRILGEEHPETMLVMSGLAVMLGDLGKLDEAVPMMKEVLEKRTRILGEEHPRTISALSHLADMLRDLAKMDEAASMMREVLEKRMRVLGREHPDTMVAMESLASTLEDLEMPQEAVLMRKELLEMKTRIFGDNHIDTITAMGSHAFAVGGLGKLEEAMPMMKETLEKSTRILGEDHLRTILAMTALAAMLGDLGKVDEAAAMMKDVLEKNTRILGKEHPDTISAMKTYTDLLHASDNPIPKKKTSKIGSGLNSLKRILRRK